jgi:peptidase M28-like protein
VQPVKNRSATILILTFLAIGVAAAILLDRPPAPVSYSAPASEFSAERAFVYLNEFAQKPHPIGSPEHDRVRDYLVGQIHNLGLSPEIQRSIGVTPIYQASGSVENIVARVPGTSGLRDSVLLAAHYDSVPAGPGAGDDGAGVAALLETMRALRAGQPPKNDVIFLLTDGEEEGMLGASAFVDEHPFAKDVRIAANFEGRGNAGDSQLFETSVNNAQMVRLFSQAERRASGSSLTYEIYKHMPNDTDMTVFKKGGAAGLNFGFIGHWEAYHTPLDNPGALDRGSLQRHGDYALSLARTLGNADLTKLGATRDEVFFSVPGGLFLHYPSGSIRSLVTLAIIAFLASCLYASGAYQTGVRKILWSMLIHLGLLVLVMLAAFLFVQALGWLHGHVYPPGDVLRSASYASSLVALLAAIATLLYRIIGRRLTWPAVFLGGAALLVIANIAAARWFAGGSYVLVWPLLFALFSAVFAAMNRSRTYLIPTIVLCVLALPILVLLVPLIRGFFDALGLGPLAPLLAVTLWVLMTALLPVLETLLNAGGHTFALFSFLAAVALFALGVRQTRYSEAHPKPNSITYALDADSQKALWASTSPRVDPWSAQFVGSSPVYAKLLGFYPDWLPFELLQGAAPITELATPRIEKLQDTINGDVRTLRLRITSPRHARTVEVEVENPVLSGWVNGRKLGQPEESRWNKKGKWEFGYANFPLEGVELKLETKAGGQVKLTVVDRSSGLPTIPGVSFAPRPADSMPQHSGDQTMVRRTFVF